MSTTKDNQERKHNHGTTVLPLGASYEDEFIEKVAKRASELVLDSIDGQITNLVLDEIYREIGKSVIHKALWAIGLIVGVATTAIVAWLKLKP
jgi:hypothetical protein